jgi:isochorismate synthase
VIVGALPFDGLTPATLVIPSEAAVRSVDGHTWRLTVDGARSDLSDRAGRTERAVAIVPPDHTEPPSGSGRAVGAPDRVDLVPFPTPETYMGAVKEATRMIKAGELEKVVLARMVLARTERDIDRRALLERLRAREPDAYVFAVHGFVGASPELLVARMGMEVRSNPLAGTTARSADPFEDRAAGEQLLASRKDRLEHAPVVDAVRAALGPACASLTADASPELLATGAVWHLSTPVRGRLREPAASAMRLSAALHPTPAVCGSPRDAAMSAIHRLETIDRTLYAGIVGWMDADGDGEWAVALRCAEIQGRFASLFAGAGIVADSEPRAELDETAAKFRSMLGALGHG